MELLPYVCHNRRLLLQGPCKGRNAVCTMHNQMHTYMHTWWTTHQYMQCVEWQLLQEAMVEARIEASLLAEEAQNASEAKQEDSDSEWECDWERERGSVNESENERLWENQILGMRMSMGLRICSRARICECGQSAMKTCCENRSFSCDDYLWPWPCPVLRHRVQVWGFVCVNPQYFFGSHSIIFVAMYARCWGVAVAWIRGAFLVLTIFAFQACTSCIHSRRDACMFCIRLLTENHSLVYSREYFFGQRLNARIRSLPWYQIAQDAFAACTADLAADRCAMALLHEVLRTHRSSSKHLRACFVIHMMSGMVLHDGEQNCI